MYILFITELLFSLIIQHILQPRGVVLACGALLRGALAVHADGLRGLGVPEEGAVLVEPPPGAEHDVDGGVHPLGLDGLGDDGVDPGGDQAAEHVVPRAQRLEQPLEAAAVGLLGKYMCFIFLCV